MAALWSSKAHPPMTREALAVSLDGYRLSADILVKFRRSLPEPSAHAVADEIALAGVEVLSDQISQGLVPLTTAQLAAAIRKRVTSAVGKVAEVDVSTIDILGAARKASRADLTRSVPPSRKPAASRPPSTSSDPQAPALEARSSGSSLVAPPRTLWLTALSKCSVGAALGEMADALGPALRDSTAAVLLRVLVATDPAATDRLDLFDGRDPVPALRSEICAALAAGFLRLVISRELDASAAAQLTEAAVRKALPGEAPSTLHIGKYATSEAPIRDLANRLAAIVGVPDDAPGIYAIVSPYCEALRVHFELVAQQIRRLRTT